MTDSIGIGVVTGVGLILLCLWLQELPRRYSSDASESDDQQTSLSDLEGLHTSIYRR